MTRRNSLGDVASAALLVSMAVPGLFPFLPCSHRACTIDDVNRGVRRIISLPRAFRP
jgi:hypothetical protein